MTETQVPYGPDLTIHDLVEVRKPTQPWDEILLSAREIADGVFSLMINEDFGFYTAWEKMSREKEQRVKHLLAEYLEKELLERD